MPEVRLDTTLEFIFDVFGDIFNMCYNILTNFKIFDITLFQLLIGLILLSFLIPMIITIPQNMDLRMRRASDYVPRGTRTARAKKEG